MRQIAAGQELHRDEQRPVAILTRVDDLDRVRVVEQRRVLGLALEAQDQLVVVHQVRVQHLDRHFPIERGVEALVDDAHAALAQLLEVDEDAGVAFLPVGGKAQVRAEHEVDRILAQPSGMRMFERDELTDALRAHGMHDVHQRVTGLTQFVGARK